MDDPATAYGLVAPDLTAAACVVASQLLTGLLRPPLEPGQYLPIRCTERLAEVAAVSSVESRADSYDNALAEAVNGPYKAEVIHKSGPWRPLDQVEFATEKWVHWWNHKRPHSGVGDMPPAEFEAIHYRQQQPTAAA